jgi:hypothetical protein
MKIILSLLISLPISLMGQSMTGTYEDGDISTGFNAYDPACNGPLTTLQFTLPGGNLWQVTGVDIEYSMTAQSGGWKSHQRSQIHCQNSSMTEAGVYQGTGDTGGIQAYDRNGVTIANGIYPAGTELVFEMRAWRISQGSGCNTTYNKVNNFTWIMTVYYQAVPDEGRVGIGTVTPDSSAILELKSIQKGFLPPRMTSALRNAVASPVEGLMIYCTDCTPEGIYTYDGVSWLHASGTILKDKDGDTYVTVEQNPDEDKIRMTTAGTERLIITNDGKIGVGTSSPLYSLHIKGQGSRNVSIIDTSGTAGIKYSVHVEQGGASTGNRYGIYSFLNSSNNNNHTGSTNQLTGSGSGEHFGAQNILSGNGSGPQYGVANSISNTGDSEHYGIYNYLYGTGMGYHYGTLNILSGSGQGEQTATSNYISNSGNSNHYGNDNTVTGMGSGNHYGTRNLLQGSGTGMQYGVFNEISNSNNNTHTGIFNSMMGGGSGDQYGTRNSFAANSTGLLIGTSNEISGSGNGTHYGNVTSLSGSGSGFHIGSDQTLSGPGIGIQIGTSSSITNSGPGSHYGNSTSLSGNGSGLHRGTYNALSGSGTGMQYGTHNFISNTGGNTHEGTRNELSGNGTGDRYGVRNILSGIGEGTWYGSTNQLTSSGPSDLISVLNYTSGQSDVTGIDNLIVSNGIQEAIGIINQIVSNNGGDCFGTRNIINDLSNSQLICGEDTEIVSALANVVYGSRIILEGSPVTSYGIYSQSVPSGNTKYAGYFSGDVTVTGIFNNPSDRKFKTHITPLLHTSSLEKLKAVRIYQYLYNQDAYPFMSFPQTLQTGVIAQELQVVFPELVKTNIHPSHEPRSEKGYRESSPEVEYLGVDYIGLIPHVISAMQEQQSMIDQMQEVIDRQQKMIDSLLQNNAQVTSNEK